MKKGGYISFPGLSLANVWFREKRARVYNHDNEEPGMSTIL
jgi:hypothetical protein